MSRTISFKAPDKLNRAILKELQLNARIPASEIGRRVGLSAPAVSERILKMEDEGIITGYEAKINLEKIGLPIHAFITFRPISINHKELIKLVNKTPEVKDCYFVTGSPGAFLRVATDSAKSLGELIEKLKEYGETNTSLILSQPVDSRVIDGNK